MEIYFAKCPSALKMRLRLASACPSPFAYASLNVATLTKRKFC